jgi:hypothetical protein
MSLVSKWTAFGGIFLGAVFFFIQSASAYYNLGAFWQNESCGDIKLVQVTEPTYSPEADSKTVTLASNATAGNLLVAVVYVHSFSSAAFKYTLTPTVVDSLGNTWNAGPIWNNGIYSGAPALQFFFAQNILGGADTVTVNLSPTDPFPSDTSTGLAVLEYSGLATSNVVDIAQGGLGDAIAATRNIASGSMTTTTSCDLVLAAFVDANIITPVVASPWKTESSDTSFYAVVVDNLPKGVRAGSAVNATATLTGADQSWIAGEMAFRGSSTTATAQPTKLAFTSATQADTTWNCSTAVTVQSQNASSVPTNTSTGISVNLSGSGINYFYDSSCLYPLTSSSVSIGAGTNSATYYYEPSSLGSTTITAAGLSTVNQTETVTTNVYTWVGGAGCSGNWPAGTGAAADKLCWQGQFLPPNSATAHFDGTCTVNCSPTITGNISVGGIWIHSGYTGTITQGSNTITIANLFEQDGGTFSGGSATITDNGNFLLTGGTFTSTSGTFLTTALSAGVLSSFTVSGSPTFNPNGGTFSFGGANNNLIVNSGSTGFNNVTFSQTASGVLTITGPMNVNGNLTVATDTTVRVEGGGTINAKGNVTDTSGETDTLNGACGSATPILNFAGSTNQTATGLSATLPCIQLTSTGGTVQFSSSVGPIQSWVYNSGTVDMTTNSTTVSFGAINGVYAITPGTMAFNNVAFSAIENNDTEYLLNGTMVVNGNLAIAGSVVLDAGTAPGTINLSGNLTNTGTGSGSANLAFISTGTQTYTEVASPFRFGGTLSITNGGTLQLASTMNGFSFGANFDVVSGTLNLNGFNFGASGVTLTVSIGGTVSAQGGEAVTLGVTTFDIGSNMNYSGNGSTTYHSLNMGSSYANLTFNSGNTWQAAATTTVNGNLTVNAGVFDTDGNSLTVAGNISGAGTLTDSGAAKTLTFDGTTQSFSETNSIGGLKATVNSGSALTLNSGFTEVSGGTFKISNGGTVSLNGHAINVGTGTITVGTSGTTAVLNCNGGCGTGPITTCGQNSSPGLVCTTLTHPGTINP